MLTPYRKFLRYMKYLRIVSNIDICGNNNWMILLYAITGCLIVSLEQFFLRTCIQ